MNDYGTVTYRGKEITLGEQAYQTSRLMNEYSDEYTFQGSGPAFVDEWVAEGETEDGMPVEVVWHFLIAREGEEVEGAYSADTLPENYDWDAVEYLREL